MVLATRPSESALAEMEAVLNACTETHEREGTGPCQSCIDLIAVLFEEDDA